MAANITLSYFGPPEQKHAIKVPPMQTLGDALQAASAKFKPALVPAQCTLQYNKRPVDLQTPFRLLNIPPGSKLEVLINRSTATTTATTAPASASSSQQQQAPSTSSLPEAAADAPGASKAATAAQASGTGQQTLENTTTTASVSTQPAAEPLKPSAGGPSATPGDAAGPSGGGSGAGATTSSPLAALGVEGQLYVFHQRTLEAAAAQAHRPMDLDPPDEFFELTPDDLVRLQQQANEKRKQESVFRTRALREAEQASRAAAHGPVRMRLHFPDATIVQASFAASQPLSAVQQLVTKIAEPNMAPALYLYTTPPKTVLKDLTASLYQLKLVPAAHIYVGCDAKKLSTPAQATGAGAEGVAGGPFLRPEVMALMQDQVPEQPAAEQQQDTSAAQQAGRSGTDQKAAADAQRMLAAAAAASRLEAGSSRAAGAGGGKVPKWMKMGK